MALCRSLRPACSCSTFLLGLGVYLKLVRPRSSSFQAACHCLAASRAIHVVSVDFSG